MPPCVHPSNCRGQLFQVRVQVDLRRLDLLLLLLLRTRCYVSVSLGGWSLLSPSSVHADPSLSTYDVIHMSRDIASDADRTRDWCLSGNTVCLCGLDHQDLTGGGSS